MRVFLTSLLLAMSKTRKSFYAVRIGRNTGVYPTWKECQAQVNGFSGAVFKGFSTKAEADQFVNGDKPSLAARNIYSGDFVSTRRDRLRCHSSSGPLHGRLQHSRSSSPSHDGQTKLPVVYSDGCCFGNGYKTATGGVGVYWGDGHSHNVSEKLEGHQTNQRAELVSACRALETAIQQGHNEVELRTDSSYTINAMTKWVSTWEKNGWKTATHQHVKNQQDIERLHRLCQRIKVKWTHVPGHKGIQGNEAADCLAKAGAQQ